MKTESFKMSDADSNNGETICLPTDEQLTKVCKKLFTKPSKYC